MILHFIKSLRPVIVTINTDITTIDTCMDILHKAIREINQKTAIYNNGCHTLMYNQWLYMFDSTVANSDLFDIEHDIKETYDRL